MSKNHEIIVTTTDALTAIIEKALKDILQPKGKAVACPDTIITPKQVARMLRVNDLEVYHAIRDGRLPAIRRGRCWKIRQGDVSRWQQAKTA